MRHNTIDSRSGPAGVVPSPAMTADPVGGPDRSRTAVCVIVDGEALKNMPTAKPFICAWTLSRGVDDGPTGDN